MTADHTQHQSNPRQSHQTNGAALHLPILERLLDLKELRAMVPNEAGIELYKIAGSNSARTELQKTVIRNAERGVARWRAEQHERESAATHELSRELAAALRAGGALGMQQLHFDWMTGKDEYDHQMAQRKKAREADAEASSAAEHPTRPGWMGPWEAEQLRQIKTPATNWIDRAHILGAPPEKEDILFPAPELNAAAEWTRKASTPVPGILATTASSSHQHNHLQKAFILVLYGPWMAEQCALILQWGRLHAGLMDPGLQRHLDIKGHKLEQPQRLWTTLLPSAGQEFLDIWNEDKSGLEHRLHWLSQSFGETEAPRDLTRLIPPELSFPGLRLLESRARPKGAHFKLKSQAGRARMRRGEARAKIIQITNLKEESEFGTSYDPAPKGLGLGRLGWSGPERQGIQLKAQLGAARANWQRFTGALEELRKGNANHSVIMISLALQLAPDSLHPNMRSAVALAREAGRHDPNWPVPASRGPGRSGVESI